MNASLPEQLPIDEIIDSMIECVRERIDQRPLLVGIQTGGLWIAEKLHETLQLEEPIGAIDISFYRDDFSRIGINPEVHTSNLPRDIEDRHIILVDDILHTGRTVRAALNELFAWGRPASVTLAVLIDRGNRELPFHAEIVGHAMSLGNEHFVKISPSGKVTYTILSN